MKSRHVFKACRKRIREEQEQQAEKWTTERPKAKQTHPFHVSKEIATQQTCPGITQTPLIDPKDTKLKILKFQ